MLVGQLDADLGGQLLGQRVVPLVVFGEEALGVDVNSRPPIVVTGMSSLLRLVGSVLAGHGHVGRQRERSAGQQHVPVHPAERQLAPVVDMGLLEQS